MAVAVLKKPFFLAQWARLAVFGPLCSSHQRPVYYKVSGESAMVSYRWTPVAKGLRIA